VSKKEGYEHSVHKWEHLMNMIETEFDNVYVTPKQIHGVWIVPLFAWYEPDFDSSYDGSTSFQSQWLDFRKVKWPTHFYDQK